MKPRPFTRHDLEALARALHKQRPGAAASLREGLDATLTVTRLGITGSLLKTVDSTNPVESMIEIVRDHSRRVKRWSSGEMALRWAAAGMLAAEGQFRRVKGYRELAAARVLGLTGRTLARLETPSACPLAGGRLPQSAHHIRASQARGRGGNRTRA